MKVCREEFMEMENNFPGGAAAAFCTDCGAVVKAAISAQPYYILLHTLLLYTNGIVPSKHLEH